MPVPCAAESRKLALVKRLSKLVLRYEGRRLSFAPAGRLTVNIAHFGAQAQALGAGLLVARSPGRFRQNPATYDALPLGRLTLGCDERPTQLHVPVGEAKTDYGDGAGNVVNGFVKPVRDARLFSLLAFV